MGRYVCVEVNGKLICSISLDKDTLITEEGYKGKFVFSIKKCKIRMMDSSCPLKLCVKQGEISLPGEEIVCIPNRVRIYIKGGSNIDGISR